MAQNVLSIFDDMLRCVAISGQEDPLDCSGVDRHLFFIAIIFQRVLDTGGTGYRRCRRGGCGLGNCR